jgi:hypothetical protein
MASGLGSPFRTIPHVLVVFLVPMSSFPCPPLAFPLPVLGINRQSRVFNEIALHRRPLLRSAADACCPSSSPCPLWVVVEVGRSLFPCRRPLLSIDRRLVAIGLFLPVAAWASRSNSLVSLKKRFCLCSSNLFVRLNVVMNGWSVQLVTEFRVLECY